MEMYIGTTWRIRLNVRVQWRCAALCQIMSVCVSVCLSVREDISVTTLAIVTKLFVRVAYVHGSVLLRHVYDRSHRYRPE